MFCIAAGCDQQIHQTQPSNYLSKGLKLQFVETLIFIGAFKNSYGWERSCLVLKCLLSS